MFNARILIWTASLILVLGASPALALNTAPPDSPVKLIFIHHSTGENWLADGGGNLALNLHDNNYFVSDTNYGWGPDGIGDMTDIGHWYLWFNGPSRDVYTSAVYRESEQNSSYTRLVNDPGGEKSGDHVQILFPQFLPGRLAGRRPHHGRQPHAGRLGWGGFLHRGQCQGHLPRPAGLFRHPHRQAVHPDHLASPGAQWHRRPPRGQRPGPEQLAGERVAARLPPPQRAGVRFLQCTHQQRRPCLCQRR